MRIHVILAIQIFSGDWRTVRTQDKAEFSSSCVDTSNCNENSQSAGYQCSVCVEDEDRQKKCLSNFLKDGWFGDQCSIPSSCQLRCQHGTCVDDDESYRQACLCLTGFYDERCGTTAEAGDIYFLMIQWNRQNAFAAPGAIKKFYYRLVGDIVLKGIRRMFVTGLGHIVNLGDKLTKSSFPPKKIIFGEDSYESADDYVEMQFPYLLPNNEYNVKVLKLGDRLTGYLSNIDAIFWCNNKFYTQIFYKVFVNYDFYPVLKCVPVIQLTNCAKTEDKSDKFVFNRNENLVINYDVKYLEDGAFASTAKENRQTCTDKDTTWTWTWSKKVKTNRFGKYSEYQDKGASIGHLRMFTKFTLDFGTYRANLRIKRVIEASTNENFNECYFQVQPLPLKCVVDGAGLRRVIKKSGITFVTKQSYDPNQPADEQSSLMVYWSCECLTTEISNCENTCKKKHSWISVFQEFFIPGSELQYNAEYRFTATLDSTNKYNNKAVAPQYCHVMIKVANETVKGVTNYYIQCIQNCDQEKTLPNEILFLKSKVSVSGKLSRHEFNASIEFDWVYSKEDESVLHPVEDSMKIADLPSTMLAIKPNTFEPGVSYFIRLKERDNQNVVAEYAFKNDEVKYNGSCKVEPPSGIRGLSYFDIVCDGLPGFIFEFYDKNEEDLAEKEIFNGRMLGTSEFQGVLKDVKITRGNIEIYIIQKDSKLFVKKDINVELTPWNITDRIMEEIKENLTSTANLNQMTTIMNYISFIPDMLPGHIDKGEVLELLLKPISQVKLHTVADVKLSASTLKIVLQTLNKPKPISVKVGLIGKTLLTINSQTDILKKAVKFRDTSKWLSTEEVNEVSRALVECLNAALNSELESTIGLTEESMGFDNLFTLRQNAQTNGVILDNMKDILSYSQAAGLPPAELASLDKTFQIWAMGNDEEYPVSDMLKKNNKIPFAISKDLSKVLSKEKPVDADLFFQSALIGKNIYSWSQSEVKSKLVSLDVAFKTQDETLKKLKQLVAPILVKIPMDKNLTSSSVKGSARQLDDNLLTPTELDLKISVHRIYNQPKGFITIRFMYPPTTESLRVLVMENFRPGYDLMTDLSQTVIINSSNPTYPLKHHSVDLPIFLYMGILPGKNVAVNKTVDYEFQVTENLCQLWIDGQWSSIGCKVSQTTTREETGCLCEHLSIFAAAFPVPPQSIDPFADAKLFLTVLDNPIVVVFVIILFIIYLLLILWGRHKDKIDKYKSKVVVLDDNFPEDSFPYLIAVHTSARFNAGTTAHVGIKLEGKEANSRAHILSSQRRKVLTRNSDDWFMIYTPKMLGDVYGVHVWHDNYGSRPEWYCDKMVVYDLTKHTEAVFIVEQWLALREGDFPEAHLVMASDTDMLNIKRMFLDNSILGFRDSHTVLSVFVRHPRSEVTRVQRLSILMLTVMVAMLCSIMFYAPNDNKNSLPTDDFQYSVGMREIIISIQTVIITAALTLVVLMSFKRAYQVNYSSLRTRMHFRKDDIAEAVSHDSVFLHSKPDVEHQGGGDKSFFDNYVKYVSKFFKSPPLAPVYMWEGEENVKKRKIWYTLAWTSCIIIIVVSAYFVMLYGLKLGFVQSQKWLTSLVMSVGEDMFVMGPGRIIFIAILLSMAFQVSTKVDLHGISVKDAMLARPKNELNYLNILLAKRSHPMYAPLSSSARLYHLEKQLVRRKWWNLIDFMNVVFFVITVSAVIYRLWTSNYHQVGHLRHVFSVSHLKQFNTLNINEINNIPEVETYLEFTLVEALFNLWWYNQQLLTVEPEPEGIRKYWLDNFIHKPISKPLLRQVRVVPNDCRNVYFENMTRCLLEWSLSNKDENVYGEKWVPATYLDTTKKDSPWEYRDRETSLWWTNLRFYGYYGTLYDVSGYDTFIGPTLKEAQKTLAELRENNWQDWFTRACFTTLTVYNVNDQTFSQITILFEYFVDGSMRSKIMVIPVSRVTLLGAWEVIFFLFGVYYVFRSGYLINRQGLIDYLKSLNNVTRIVNVFLTFLAVIIWCVHHQTSIEYSENYMKNEQADYFDFDNFIHTFSILQIVLSLLIVFIIARAFMLLRGGRRFLNIFYALKLSLALLFWVVLGFLLLAFVCRRLQYFLDCQEFFRMKELILPQKMTAFVSVTVLENPTVKVFILIRLFVMFFIHVLLVLMFYYYFKLAKGYNPKPSDDFNFVLFVIERVKRFFSRNRNLHE